MSSSDPYYDSSRPPEKTAIDSAERAREELAKIYGAGVVVFARSKPEQRFPYEVGYRTHNGHRVVAVVVGRGATWVNALDNAERRINRELHGKRDARPRRRNPLLMPSLFPEE